MSDTATQPAGPSDATSAGEPKEQKLTSMERNMLISDLRLAFHYQRTFWDALRTGIALGAEEVQDQRLAALEEPPEGNPALDIFLLLTTFLLESPAVAPLARGVQGMVVSMLKRQLRLQDPAYLQLITLETTKREALDKAATKAASRLAKAERRNAAAAAKASAGNLKRAKVATENNEAAQKELDIAQKELDAVSSQRMSMGGRFKKTMEVLKGLREGPVAAEFFIAAGKVGVQLAQRRADAPSPKQLATPADVSLGVSVRAQVEKEALGVIQESYCVQELCELALGDEQLTVEQAAAVFEVIGTVKPLDVGMLLDRYQLITAGVIWAQLLQVQGLRTSRRSDNQQGSLRVPGVSRPISLFTAPKKHSSYLVSRFGDSAEAWARHSPDKVELPYEPYGWNPNLEEYLQAGRSSGREIGLLESLAKTIARPIEPEDVRLDLVLQWLEAMTEGAPNILRRPTTQP